MTSPEINNNYEYDNTDWNFVYYNSSHVGRRLHLSLIDNQQITNFSLIALIAGISMIIAIVLLRWNIILKERVTQKTSELRETVDKLSKV